MWRREYGFMVFSVYGLRFEVFCYVLELLQTADRKQQTQDNTVYPSLFVLNVNPIVVPTSGVLLTWMV
jgi:hypothetical protein